MRRRNASTQMWDAVYHEYAHRDHLGSVDAITDGSGTVLQKTSFDPYGGRRTTAWNADLSTAGLDALRAVQDSRGSRGFTDHEHQNRTGFVHMNGRVYDPRIGRFVSPDPIVQAPWFSQSYNRYAYVFGSPVSYSDPSGFAAGALQELSITVVRNPGLRSGLYESGSEGLSFSFGSMGSGAGGSGYYNPEAGLTFEFYLPDIPGVTSRPPPASGGGAPIGGDQSEWGPGAINEAIVVSVDDRFLEPFESEDDVAFFLHDRLYGLSIRLNIEIGARIYSVHDRWFFTMPRTDFRSNEVYSGAVPAAANGGVAGVWHSHPSGKPFNATDFGQATGVRERQGRTTYVSHLMDGQPMLSRVYFYSRRVLTLQGGQWRDLGQFLP